MESFHMLSTEEVARKLKSDLIDGLNDSEARSRLLKYGRNELPQEAKTPLWKLFLEQFNDVLVRILLLAAIVSAILGITEAHEISIDSVVEPLVIMFVLIVNASISVKQSKNAEDAIEALREYEPDMAKVIRSHTKNERSTVKLIKASELVPGDLVEVAVGDRIPADIRITEILSSCLQVDQSILTGECMSISKITECVNKKDVVNQDKINIIFSGTNVVKGKSRGIVVGTGLNTEIGKIRDQISNITNERTPLQNKLDEFGDQLSKLISVICVTVWVINIGHFGDPIHGNSWFRGAIYYFKIAIALAVAAIPEGLPAVITTCLAIGTRRMAKKNAIVRSLPSVETLGCVSVICSDKTGTLTTNQMSVMKVFLVNLTDSDNNRVSFIEYHSSGTTYNPRDGKIELYSSSSSEKIEKNSSKSSGEPSDKVLEELTCVALLCNESSLSYNKEKGIVERVGEATEAALLTFGEKLNAYKLESSSCGKMNSHAVAAVRDHVKSIYTSKAVLEFSRSRKSMGVLVSSGNSTKIMVKGAPESVLDRCTYICVAQDGHRTKMTEDMKNQILQKVAQYGTGRDTLRCLALAVVDNPVSEKEMNLEDSSKFVDYEKNMTFLGVVGMIDPPRPEVADAIAQCKMAGIRVMMITGDNKNTAEAICRRIGILSPDEDSSLLAFSAQEFDQLSPAKQAEACKRARLFARVEPAHKSKIVSYLQSAGEITAMTGDGVNDAPALKKAEIGVAMGSGTAVAKSAADMVLADDNFSSIVAAVAEGRAICGNTIQFISYLVSSNIGEVVSIFITSILCLPEGLIPVQLLWVNLITDGLPATALGFNPPEPDIMCQKPRNAKEPLISRWQMFRYTVVGLYVGLATIVASVWWYLYDPDGPLLTFAHLTSHQKCSPDNPMFAGVDCEIFNNYIPMTMALSVLVVVEMLNAFNSVSENQSIFVFPPYKNMLLVFAVTASIIIHLITLSIPFTQRIFNVIMLNSLQWKIVLLLSFPVLLVEEILKFYHRNFISGKKIMTGKKLKAN